MPAYSELLTRRRAYWSGATPVPNEPVEREIERLRKINKKIGGYKLARKVGVATPLIGRFKNFSEALSTVTVDRFVVKPLWGHSSLGVYLLERAENGSYYCHMHKRAFEDQDELNAFYDRKLAAQRRRAREKRWGISRNVLLESFIDDAAVFDVPLDYKLYTFRSGAALIMQRYAPFHLPHEDWSFRFYSPDGEDLGPIRLDTDNSGYARSMPRPHNLPALLDTANRLVAAAKVSFVRVDLYESTQGIVFGEFTPIPNAAKERFEPVYDELLGSKWEDSLKDLGLSY